MGRPPGAKTVRFGKAKEAREAISERLSEIVDGYLTLIKDAHAAESWDVAMRGYQFLLEHAPKDEDGTKVLDQSVNKEPAKVQGPTGPTIQIGIALSGPKPVPALPEATVEAEVIDTAPDSN
jgi:hypothetical protein